MSAQVVEEFEKLCQHVASAFVPTLGEDKLEPLYGRLLDFLRMHEDYRKELASSLIGIMEKYRHSRESKQTLLPGSAIAYCMHELRWPEIYQFAESENRDFYSKRMATFMTDIMAAYDDDWEDKEFYRRFS
jgi:hypothetical protein